MKITELKAGVIKVENTSKVDQSIIIYVPNKYDMPYVIGAGDSINITTLSAGESYSYLCQATDDIKITLSNE